MIRKFKFLEGQKMKSIGILGIWILIFLLSLLLIPKGKSVLLRVIFIWLSLNTFICLFEILVLLNRTKMCETRGNFWTREQTFQDSLKRKFWIEAWSEYAKFDPRYCNPQSKVYLFELTNVLVSFIPSVVMIGYLVYTKFEVEKIPHWVFILLMLGSGVQFISTSIYLLTGVSQFNRKYSPYVILDLPWLIMPLIVIIWSYRIIRSEKLR